MSNYELILEMLENLNPCEVCDDCLSAELHIKPRQQVNSICRTLKNRKQLYRQKGTCFVCDKQKIVNFKHVITHDEDERVDYAGIPPNKSRGLDIEKYRTFIVKICSHLWREKKREQSPRSISAMINQLRSDGFIPNHYANLMLTVCNLRNVYVYEGFEIGNREEKIAEIAMEVINEWWNTARQR